MLFLRSIFFITLCFWGSWKVRAQTAEHVPGVLLISLPGGQEPESLLRRFYLETGLTMRNGGYVAPLLHIWRLETDASLENAALLWLKRQIEVGHAQFDLVLNDRTAAFPPLSLPDDPQYALQWHFDNIGTAGGTPDADLDAPEAWDITTGGISPAGDTIVVAVIDRGLDYLHADLSANLWQNNGEIPGDFLDNDGNGYVDDFRGWNVMLQNDQIGGQSASHGTPVCGIIGARGNNTIGVSGTNWKIKILFVASRTETLSDNLAAFNYVLANRRLYRKTQGSKGAFIVSLNCSWGADNKFPDDAPLWCAAYDSLGAEGIVSVGATANNPVNVDIQGDLPTTCPSPYLISVTSLTKQDLIASNAAWGAENIDLGAYGADIFTIRSGNAYGAFTGTSAAAPQVSGAIGLLYAAPCPTLTALGQVSPKDGAILVKKLVLDNTQPNASLDSVTLTGGRLNLFNLLNSYQSACASCPAPFSLKAIGQNDGLLLTWTSLPSIQTVQIRFREAGIATWNEANASGQVFSYFLSGLKSCTGYEISLRTVCEPGDTSAWTLPQIFSTSGCCLPPEILNVLQDGTQMWVTWTPVEAAQNYILKWRKGNSGDWSNIPLGNNTAAWAIPNLEPCSDYQIVVISWCSDSAIVAGALYEFTTTGCGACTELNYCTAGGNFNSEEWIGKVQIGSWQHNSGMGGGGYQNFTGIKDSILVLTAGEIYSVSLTPVFAGVSYKEYFKIFIDYNSDGDFDESNELAFDALYGSYSTVHGILSVPVMIAENSVVKMRVMMKYFGPLNDPPEACENYQFGQVEDYCVRLQGTFVSSPANLEVQNGEWRIFPNPGGDYLDIFWKNTSEEAAMLLVYDAMGQQVEIQELAPYTKHYHLDTQHWKQGAYFLAIQNHCTTKVGKIWIKQ